jgi:hypothetical protein
MMDQQLEALAVMTLSDQTTCSEAAALPPTSSSSSSSSSSSASSQKERQLMLVAPSQDQLDKITSVFLTADTSSLRLTPLDLDLASVTTVSDNDNNTKAVSIATYLQGDVTQSRKQVMPMFHAALSNLVKTWEKVNLKEMLVKSKSIKEIEKNKTMIHATRHKKRFFPRLLRAPKLVIE